MINNESQAQEITIYLSDWTRISTGENDFLALNSARWLFARAFHADDELDIKYRALIPSDSITVNLHIHALQDFSALRIDEVFSSHVSIESIDDAGGEFTTVSHSCGDWIIVAPQTFTISPGATQPVSFRVVVPDSGVSGMYWAMIFVEGSPRQQLFLPSSASVLRFTRRSLDRKSYRVKLGACARWGE